MSWWDKQFRIRLAESNIIIILYKRYVDDKNFIINKPKQIRENRIEQEEEEEDKEIMEKMIKQPYGGWPFLNLFRLVQG